MSSTRLKSILESNDYDQVLDFFQSEPLTLNSSNSNLILKTIANNIYHETIRALYDYFGNDIIVFLTSKLNNSDSRNLLYHAILDKNYPIVKALFDEKMIIYDDDFQLAIKSRDPDIIQLFLDIGFAFPELRFGKQPVQCQVMKYDCRIESDRIDIENFKQLEMEQRDFFMDILPLTGCRNRDDFYIIGFKDLPEGRLLCGSMRVEREPGEYIISLFATQTLLNPIVKGVGDMMIKYLIKDAKNHGIYRIVVSPSDTAFDFYKKYGFGPEGSPDLFVKYL